MRVMGFSVDPGNLPLTTVRGEKWETRVEPGDYIRMHPEPPCAMQARTARVVAVYPHNGPPPPHVASLYAGQRLYAVDLDVPDRSDDELRATHGIPI